MKKSLLLCIICGLCLCAQSSFAQHRTSNGPIKNHLTRHHAPQVRVQQTDAVIPSSGKNTFVFNPRTRQWAAYDPSGRLMAEGKGSGGKSWCADVGRRCHTKTGTFNIYRKQGAECKSSKYPVGIGKAPMPYCMFFTGGFAIHASADVPPWNASHGCVRVPHQQAVWLYSRFKVGDRVVIKPY